MKGNRSTKGVARPTTQTAPKHAPPKTARPQRYRVDIDLPVDVWLDLWGIKRDDEHSPADVVRRLIREGQGRCGHPEIVADAGGNKRCGVCAQRIPA